MSTPSNGVRRCPQCNVENAGSADRCIVCGSDLASVDTALPTPVADRPPSVAAITTTAPSSDVPTGVVAGDAASPRTTLVAAPPEHHRSHRLVVGAIAIAAVIAATAMITFVLTNRSDSRTSPLPTSEPVVVETRPTLEVVDGSTTTAQVALPTSTTAPPTTPPPTTTLPTTVATTASPMTTRAPNPVPVVARASASSVRGDSVDGCGDPTNYDPALAIDGFRDTAWMTPGDGSGQTLTISLTGPSIVREVGLVPGYDKFDACTGTDRFLELRRVTAVRWTFDDGSSVDQIVDPSPAMHTMSLPSSIVTTSVTLTILSTTPPGLDRLDHTPISEVHLG